MEEAARVTWNTLTMATPTSGEPFSPAQNDDDDPQQHVNITFVFKYFGMNKETMPWKLIFKVAIYILYCCQPRQKAFCFPFKLHRGQRFKLYCLSVINRSNSNFVCLIFLRSGHEGSSSGVPCGGVFTCPPSRAAFALNPWSLLTNAIRTVNDKKHSWLSTVLIWL